MSSSKNSDVELAIYSIVGGGLLTGYGIKRFFRTRKTVDTATSKVATAAQGFAEIQGYAWPAQDKTFANLDGQKSVYRKMKIERHVRVNKRSYWQTVCEFSNCPNFYLFDESGAVIVLADGMELEIEKSTRKWTSISLDTRQRLLEEVRQNSVTETMPDLNPGFFSGSYRCVEQSLVVGSPVLVHGHLNMPSGMQKLVNDLGMLSFHKQLKTGSPSRRRRDFDTNRDGEICEDEARSGFHSAAALAYADKSPPIPDNQGLKLYGMVTCHQQHASFIADCHQEHLVRRLGSWNLSCIVAGVLLIASGIFYLLIRTRIISPTEPSAWLPE